MVLRTLPSTEQLSPVYAGLHSAWTTARHNGCVRAVRNLCRFVQHRWLALCFTRRFYTQACRSDAAAPPAELPRGPRDISELLLQRSIPPRLHVMVQLRAASQIACIAETVSLTNACWQAGWSEDQIKAAIMGTVTELFSEPEMLALRYADEMTRTPIDVDPQTLKQLRKHFDPSDMTELTASIAHENFRCRFTDANNRIR